MGETRKGIEKMKLCILSAVVGCAATCLAAPFRAGEGIANDRATGAHDRDVTYVSRGQQDYYGYRGYDLAIGGTLFAWAMPNEESSVTGLRLNFGWGLYRATRGLDVGAFSVGREASALQANLLGQFVTGDAHGLQVGGVNVVGGEMCGVQIGFVNVAERLSGLQIGLLNFAVSQHFFPILNMAF